MTELRIRPAEDRDVPKIAALESACFSDPWSEASAAGTLHSPLGYVLIAEQPDGEGNALPLGYLIASVFEDEGELLRIAAAPSARRRGVGEALLGHMLADILTDEANHRPFPIKRGMNAVELFKQVHIQIRSL